MEKPLLNEVKAILKSLVLSCPEKITIEQLNRDYRDVEGQLIPFRKLGYGNVEHFLRSIPDTLKVFGSGPTAMVCFVANEKSDHIHDMIMKQRKPKAKRTRARSKSAGRSKNYVPQRGNRFNSQFEQNTKRPGQQLSPFQSVNRKHTTKTPQIREVPKFQQQHNYVPPFLSNQILCALPQPSGILTNPLQNLNYNIALNLLQNQAQKNEYHVRQVSSLLRKQCHITTPPPPLPRHQSRPVKFSPETNSAGHSKNCSIVTKNVCNEMKAPKATTQAPIKLSDEVEYLVNMPKLIQPTNPIVEFSTNETSKEQQKKEIPPLVKKEDLSKMKLPKRFFDDSIERAEDLNEAVPLFAAKNNVFRLDFPEHTVLYGRKIAPYKLDDDITVGSCIKIFVSEIHNPFKFWFHIHKDNHDLDLLMYQIERYYSSIDAEVLRIPMTCLTPGQVCAASYNGLWHRAEIVAPPVNTTIKVSFMDYGTVTEVEIKNIKFLASYFAKLPAQALRGCLSHIKPRTMHWSHESTTYFLTLVAELMLYAKIAEIDREQNILYMILCDTNGDEVIQINKSLVEKRYALYNEEWKSQKISQKNGKRVHHPREDFPTFSMIESGEYPSFIELVNLQERGIDYETIYDLIIYNQSTILNKHENVPERIRNLPYFLTTSNPFRSDILLELHATTTKAI